MPGKSCQMVLIMEPAYNVCVLVEGAPYELVKGQQMKNLISEVAKPLVTLATNLEDGQSCQIQVGIINMCCECSVTCRWRLSCITVRQSLECATSKLSS